MSRVSFECISRVSAASLAVLAVATAAFAQTPADDRVFISAGFGQQAKSASFSSSRTVTLNAEPARFEERYGGRAGSAFDVSGAWRLLPKLWVGGGFSQASYRAGVDVSAELPHPFFFSRPRAIAGSASGLLRTESDAYAHVMYRMPIGTRLALSVFAGPTWITASQDVVDTTGYSELYPYDTATFTDVALSRQSQTKATVGGGVDASYRVLNHVFVGVGIRYAGATVRFETPSGNSVRVIVGGTDATAGVRLGF